MRIHFCEVVENVIVAKRGRYNEKVQAGDVLVLDAAAVPFAPSGWTTTDGGYWRVLTDTDPDRWPLP